jgi:cellulose synthase/poly-beta-1,6-N-acetylglucosamine synthase-like glycosyltransferase
MLNFVKNRKKLESKLPIYTNDEDLPTVTIQLPLYNEAYVTERLLQCIAAIDYPKNKLQIQVLDDSTDESLIATQNHVKALQEQHYDIIVIHRIDRTGYKAGALKQGLETASGEFVAIFDADFLPEKNWLREAVRGFVSEDIGLVQTRWGHINSDYSVLTRMQAFALDIHFTLEQSGRNAGGHFINFNGTAGIWRKTCILDAGNWSGDTLTEDLDLSYRAQIKGWKFNYLEDVVAPAELPVVMSAAKSQQFRWNKGGAENMLKSLFKIYRNKTIPFSTKWHATFHLGNSSIFIFILLVSLLSIPMIYIKESHPYWQSLWTLNAIFCVSTILLFICHWAVYKVLHGGSIIKFFKFIGNFIVFFTLALGFSYHNSKAVGEAYVGKRSAFIRTPKFNMLSNNDSWKSNKYLNKQISLSVIIELLLLIYFVFGVASSFYLKEYTMLPFHLMLTIGFGFVVTSSLRDR